MSLAKALDETRTGDLWLFRGSSGPDRAIQTMSNSPVNHVGMTIAIEDLPPLIWHAELGDKLTDMWTAAITEAFSSTTHARPSSGGCTTTTSAAGFVS